MTARVRAVLLLTLAPAPLLAQGQVVTLSNPTAQSAEPLTNVSGLRELSDGRVLVSDALEKSVRLVDLARGTSVPVGREGQGPGEYGFPGELLPLAGDTTLLVDRVNRRFLVIHPDGKTGTTIPFPGSGFMDPRGIDRQGRIYFQGTIMPGEITPGQALPDSAPVLRWARSGERLDTVAFVKLPARQVNVSGGSQARAVMMRSQPYSPEDAWGVAPDGRVAVARINDYHVDWFTPGGQKISGPANPVPPVPVTEADKEELRKQMSAAPRMMMRIGGTGGASRSTTPPPIPTPDMGEMEFPATKPTFAARSVWVTPEGMLWVLRSRRADDEVPMVDVFDHRGYRVGQVRLPTDRRVVGFGAGTVYLARTDADDLVWVETYRR